MDNYESGFSRIGINLREEQIDTLKIRLNEHFEIREEWSKFQKEWVEDFIFLLRENKLQTMILKWQPILGLLKI